MIALARGVMRQRAAGPLRSTVDRPGCLLRHRVPRDRQWLRGRSAMSGWEYLSGAAVLLISKTLCRTEEGFHASNRALTQRAESSAGGQRVE